MRERVRDEGWRRRGGGGGRVRERVRDEGWRWGESEGESEG